MISWCSVSTSVQQPQPRGAPGTWRVGQLKKAAVRGVHTTRSLEKQMDNQDDVLVAPVAPTTPEPMDAEVLIQIAPAPPLEDLSNVFTCTFDIVSQQTVEKLYSLPFEIGTYVWRLMVFPKGNNLHKNRALSVYLECVDSATLPPPMCPTAQFSLTILNHLDSSKHWTKETTHRFIPTASDWGFEGTVTLEEVYREDAGFLYNDFISIKVMIKVTDSEGASSRKDLGFVGFKNQGATCYMNSLLQYLYNLPMLRRAVFHMPETETEEDSNMPLALQRLFFKLQYSPTTVSTKALTTSFGWKDNDAFQQHDVQELNRVLCEKLEEKMKGTRVEKVITDLFEGHTTNFIRCLNVPFTSERKESFMDLQLDVRGCPNIPASFKKYCEVEIMDGANQYFADGHGLQDAEKGVTFLSFPPVLQLQLKRFEYDFQRDVMIKINDRYEFSETLDLDPYLAVKADRSVRNHYLLHAVLVHSGGVNGGHYYAFVRPDKKRWLRFDDERVTLETQERAMNDQYGGDEESTTTGFNGSNGPAMRFPKNSNAYMLVYIRESDYEQVMCKVAAEDIELPLRMRLQSELSDKERRQREKKEAHLYVTVKVAQDADIKQQIDGGQRTFELVDHNLLEPNMGSFRVPKRMSFVNFKQQMAAVCSLPPEKQRYWVWMRRANGTFRPGRVLTAEQEQLTVLELTSGKDVTQKQSKNALGELHLYLETPLGAANKAGAALAERLSVGPNKWSSIMLFFKYYDAVKGELKFLGRKHLPVHTTISQVCKFWHKFLGLPEGERLEAWEEVKQDPALRMDKLDKKKQLDEMGGQDGDIIILQRELDPDEAKDLAYPSVDLYFKYVHARRMVTFKRLEEPGEAGQQVELRQDMNYDEVTGALAAHLGLQPVEEAAEKLRLTQHSIYVHGPNRTPMKWRAVGLTNMFMNASARAHSTTAQTAAQPNDIIYYEVLDMPLQQLEQLKTLKVTFHKESGEAAGEHTVRLRRDALVSDLLEEVAKVVGPTAQGRPLRLFETHSSKLFKVCLPTESIDHVDDVYWHLRVEVVPEDEVGLDVLMGAPHGPPLSSANLAALDIDSEPDRLLHCYHFCQEKPSASPAPTVFGPVSRQGPAQGPGQEQGGPVPMDLGSAVPLGGGPGFSPAVDSPPEPSADMPGLEAPDGAPLAPYLLLQSGGGGGGVRPMSTPTPPPTPAPGADVQGAVNTFGEPLIVRCGPRDTLAILKARLQAKLGISDEALAKWRWAFSPSRGPAFYLGEGECVGELLARPTASIGGIGLGQHMGGDAPFLGMEHEDDKPRRSTHSNSRHGAEKAVKIYT